MNPENSTKWKAKHAWAEVDRTGPPKRPAEKRIVDFHEIYSLYDEDTVREQASRCIQCPDASCVKGCPLTNRIPEWIALAAEGDFLGAAAISRETSNLPEICSGLSARTIVRRLLHSQWAFRAHLHRGYRKIYQRIRPRARRGGDFAAAAERSKCR